MNSRKPRNRKTRDIILRYMMEFAEEQGRQPSVREIGEAAGLMSIKIAVVVESFLFSGKEA